MKRRDFLKAIPVAAAVSALPLSASAVDCTDRLTPVLHHGFSKQMGRKIHVFLDGVDVTDDCFIADRANGVVSNFVKNEQGYKFIVREAKDLKYGPYGSAATITRTGRVEYRLGGKF